ncbi:hypothetical protein [uncultured Eubacterium sp.]|uniref:hypothetical protein n=1 Tax=uncultured Eubacterium sp. TaxID=165185 RepID=UPI00259388A8|nr:hypothetical protein [uncultured Eubacterium sp.]
MRTVWQMIKLKVINNRKLWICCLCIAATTLLCFLTPFPSGDPDVKETVLKVWLSTDREQLLQMDEMASIYSVAAGFRNMEWFIVLLPLVAVVPGTFEFSEVWFGGNFYLAALRGTKKQFARKWVLECAWKAFLCVGCGIGLYIVLVAVNFLPLDAYVNDVSESIIAIVYGDTLLQRSGWLLLAIVHTGLLAAVFAMMALVLTVLWEDSFFAISCLVLLEYFSKKMASGYVGVVYERYESGGLPVPLKVRLVEFLFPSNHLFYDRSFQYAFGLPYWIYAIFISLWMGGIALLFCWQVRRRNA